MNYDQWTIYDLLEMRDALNILRKYETWAIEKYHEVCQELEKRLEKIKNMGVCND